MLILKAAGFAGVPLCKQTCIIMHILPMNINQFSFLRCKSKMPLKQQLDTPIFVVLDLLLVLPWLLGMVVNICEPLLGYLFEQMTRTWVDALFLTCGSSIVFQPLGSS